MTNDQELFWFLGRHARSGEPLPLPMRDAREVARLIHDDLSESGLSKHAIRRVASALLDVSVSAKRPCVDVSTSQRGERS